MANKITVKSSLGDKELFDINNTHLIDVDKGDYVFVPELISTLKLEIVSDSYGVSLIYHDIPHEEVCHWESTGRSPPRIYRNG